MVAATVRSGDGDGDLRQIATVVMPIEAAAVDRFVVELVGLARFKKGKACLRVLG